MQEQTNIVPTSDMDIVENDWYSTDMMGLNLHRVPTWDEWEAGIESLAIINHALPMIIGDYVNVGEDTFGERYQQVLDTFGEFAYGTVANYASICRSVPRERRIEGMTISHLKAVRALEPEEQIEWQQIAMQNGWNTNDLWVSVHGEGMEWFGKFSRFVDEIAILRGQCRSGFAGEEIDTALRHLRNAQVAEGNERNIYED